MEKGINEVLGVKPTTVPLCSHKSHMYILHTAHGNHVNKAGFQDEKPSTDRLRTGTA
jgi:hypothetical protein